MPRKKADEDVEIEVKDEKQPQEVTVELDDKNEPIKQPEKSAEVKPDYATREDFNKLKKQLDGISGVIRTSPDLVKRFDQLQTTITQLQNQRPLKADSKDQDEWDELVEKDWKQAVRGLAKLEVEAQRKQEEAERSIERENHKRTEIFEKSKTEVLEKHPELQDEDSEKAQLYREIVNTNQDYLYDPFGPVLAARKMEERLMAEGKLDAATGKLVRKEAERLARVGVTGAPKGSAPTNGSRVVLNKDQREFCDLRNIKYEDYAKYSQIVNQEGQVETV